MNILFLFSTLFSLSLLTGCDNSHNNNELPPPTPTEQPSKDDTQDDNNDPWDENRDVVVTPGKEWTATKVGNGLTWYLFNGKDMLSQSFQIVNVLEVDMKTGSYRFELSYNPSTITSQVMKDKHAIAAMNAGYEVASIFAKTDGIKHCTIKNDYINGIVPNWKNEAAVYIDNTGTKVDIEFSGKGLSLTQQRAIYFNAASPNIITSAPMLVDDYEPVGETFARTNLSPEKINELNYEDPIRHQGVRHPRTILAKTHDDRLLLITIDGRRSGISEGMSAKEATLFIVKHFNPRYAINMDGGGSTTLCIDGYGDPATHVVNYPTDNKAFDHAGERKVSTHFCVFAE